MWFLHALILQKNIERSYNMFLGNELRFGLRNDWTGTILARANMLFLAAFHFIGSNTVSLHSFNIG
jgi:hypothetical protein